MTDRIVVEAGHLGGYVVGGDDATWYPDLWTWLVREQGVRSVLDVGCGDGQALRYFRDTLGTEVAGLDGVPQSDPDILEHDFTRGSGVIVPPTVGAIYDLVWCCEFVEHVEERYVPNFLETFKLGKLVLLTHAEPGQQGYHHVNCRVADYWLGALAAIGYGLDRELTRQARVLAGRNPSPWNHFVRSGLAFRRQP